jgi:class 3 adenylate cyclase/TolB-like protein/ketosteroid isomerase-like protein
VKTVGGMRPDGGDAFDRRVVAVLLADVSGYSALMGEDDERTAHAVRQLHDFVRRIVAEARGRAEPVAGDAILATFDSVAAAVEAAIRIQKRIGDETFADMRLQLRIGVHFGDVLLGEGGTQAHGDAINVASRLQQLARPGTVCVSDGVYRQIRHRLGEQVIDLGRQTLKNISDPVRAYVIVPGTPSNGRRPARRRRWLLAAGGGALVVLATLWLARGHLPLGVASPGQRPPSADVAPAPPAVTLGVMVFKQLGDHPAHSWMRDAMRDGLNTQLSALSSVKVYSKEFLDFLVTRQGLSEIEVANRLGITKMLTGSFLAVGGQVKIDTHVVDVSSGVIEASYTTTGPQERFLDLQNDVAMGIVSQLELELTAEEREALLARRATDVDALRLLLEAEGARPAPRSAPGAAPAQEPEATSRWLDALSFPSSAAAAEAPDQEGAVRDVLERYRQAMEAGDVEVLTSLYAGLTDEQRAAQERYLANVEKLKVAIGEVDLAIVGDEAVVSYTRKDEFVDRRTGRAMEIAVRLTKTLVRDGGEWRLVPGE